MPRLIDADALIESMGLGNAVKWGNKDGYQQEHSYSTMMLYEIKDSIDCQPTVDAAPVKHGRWQWLSSTYDRTPCEMRYMCSKCRHETITHGHEPWEKYCPNCGAKMDLEGLDDRRDQQGNAEK